MRLSRVAASQTYELRHDVLRPHQSMHEMAFEGDESPEAVHVAALDPQGEVVCVASAWPEPAPFSVEGGVAWRLRGMATREGWRGRGVGADVLGALVELVRQGGGHLLWCNARMRAAPFYERAGFVAVGEVFEVEALGAHVKMLLELVR